jgi:hypothetical protein
LKPITGRGVTVLFGQNTKPERKVFFSASFETFVVIFGAWLFFQSKPRRLKVKDSLCHLIRDRIQLSTLIDADKNTVTRPGETD